MHALRRLIALVLLPLMIGGSWLAYSANASASEADVHVCRCAIRGGVSTCACPICHPEMRHRELAVRSPCGDEKQPRAAAGHGVEAVVPSPIAVSVVRPFTRVVDPRAASPSPPDVCPEPFVPPPRIAA